LAAFLISQGLPMLLGGDEIGRGKGANNNAYCHDNAISYYGWNLDQERLDARVHRPRSDSARNTTFFGAAAS
jgi:pullulanase/glycogen debranching enzyme